MNYVLKEVAIPARGQSQPRRVRNPNPQENEEVNAVCVKKNTKCCVANVQKPRTVRPEYQTCKVFTVDGPRRGDFSVVCRCSMFRTKTQCVNKALIRRIKTRREFELELARGGIESNPGPVYGVVAIHGDDVAYGDVSKSRCRSSSSSEDDWDGMPDMESDCEMEIVRVGLQFSKWYTIRTWLPFVACLGLAGCFVRTGRLRYVACLALLLAVKRRFVRTWAFFFGGGNQLVCIEANPGPPKSSPSTSTTVWKEKEASTADSFDPEKDVPKSLNQPLPSLATIWKDKTISTSSGTTSAGPSSLPQTKSQKRRARKQARKAGASGGSGSAQKSLIASLHDGMAEAKATVDAKNEVIKEQKEKLEDATSNRRGHAAGEKDGKKKEEPAPLPIAAQILKELVAQAELEGYQRVSEDNLQLLVHVQNTVQLYTPRPNVPDPTVDWCPPSDFGQRRKQFLSDYCLNETSDPLTGCLVMDTLERDLYPKILPASFSKVRTRLEDDTWNEFYNGILVDLDVVDPFELVVKVELVVYPIAHYIQAPNQAVRPYRDTESAHRDRLIAIFQPLLRVTYRGQKYRYYYVDVPRKELKYSSDNWFGNTFEFRNYTTDSVTRVFKRFKIEDCGGKDSTLFRFRTLHVSMYQLVELFSRRILLTPKLAVAEQVNRLIRFYSEDPNTSTHLHAMITTEADVVYDTMNLVCGLLTQNGRTAISDF